MARNDLTGVRNAVQQSIAPKHVPKPGIRRCCCIGVGLAISIGTASADQSVSVVRPNSAPSHKRLDLSIGDVSRYISAAELATPVNDELEEIFVNGRKPEPIPERREIPHGVFPALFYAATHPLNAWRIVIPDPYFQVPARNPDDPKEPPGAFRGKILEPGAIYD